MKGSFSGSVESGIIPINDNFKVDAGMHTLTWTWKKNDSISTGADTAWIDDVIIPVAEGNIDGTVVTDASGSSTPLIEASVKISNENIEFNTTTDDYGEYIINNVPYGSYVLTIEKAGFQTTSQDIVIDSMGITIIPSTTIPMEDTSSLYTQAQVDQMVEDERLRWDMNGDNKIDLQEAIHALSVISGK